MFSQESNTGSRVATEDFYSRLVEYMSDEVQGETLGFDEEQISNLFSIQAEVSG